jgi:ABC-2 type transport system ATP-binding protein
VECIQGLRRPDSGSLRVLGYDPATHADQLRRHVGSQLQDSALPDRLRVAEAVELFSSRRSRDGAELLERFGLGERRRSAFSSLSGGERQRLFLVLALINQPRLVILDELTQGLDPAARRNVWAAVAQLHDAGTTVLLVSHELDEAEVLCDRVVAMRGGRVLDQGRPAELVDRHARWATVRFSLPATRADLLPGARFPGRPICVISRSLAMHALAADGIPVAVTCQRARFVQTGSSTDLLTIHLPSIRKMTLLRYPLCKNS